MGEDTESFMRALGIMKLQGEEPAWSKLDFLEKEPQSQVGTEVQQLWRKIEILQKEKAQIAAELTKSQ